VDAGRPFLADVHLGGEVDAALAVLQHVSQEVVLDLAEVSVEFYARIERGKTLPSVPTLLRLATALRVSADVLLGLARVPSATRDHPIVATSPSAGGCDVYASWLLGSSVL